MIIIRNNVVFMDREEKWLGVAAAPANKYMQLHIWVTKVLRWCKCKFLEKLEKKVIIHKRPDECLLMEGLTTWAKVVELLIMYSCIS